MRELTLKGYVNTYVKELSYAHTSSVTKLLKELDKNPRLKEPLVLHCILSGMPERAASTNGEFCRECNRVATLLSTPNKLPGKYQKVIRSYQHYANKVENDNHTKLLMYDKIIEIQSTKHITNYRIYKDLKLNGGNANAFLKNGDVGKLSLNNVRAILEYVKRF